VLVVEVGSVLVEVGAVEVVDEFVEVEFEGEVWAL
jgi:hypothetical protein